MKIQTKFINFFAFNLEYFAKITIYFFLKKKNKQNTIIFLH